MATVTSDGWPMADHEVYCEILDYFWRKESAEPEHNRSGQKLLFDQVAKHLKIANIEADTSKCYSHWYYYVRHQQEFKNTFPFDQTPVLDDTTKGQSNQDNTNDHALSPSHELNPTSFGALKGASVVAENDHKDNVQTAGPSHNLPHELPTKVDKATTSRHLWSKDEAIKFREILQHRCKYFAANAKYVSRSEFVSAVFEDFQAAGYDRSIHACSCRLQKEEINEEHWNPGRAQHVPSTSKTQSGESSKSDRDNFELRAKYIAYTKEESKDLKSVLAKFQQILPDTRATNAYTTASWHDVVDEHNKRGYNRTAGSIRSFWHRKLMPEDSEQLEGQSIDDDVDSDDDSSESDADSVPGRSKARASDELIKGAWTKTELDALKSTMLESRGPNVKNQLPWEEVVSKHNEKGYNRSIGSIQIKWRRMLGKADQSVSATLNINAEDVDSEDEPLIVASQKSKSRQVSKTNPSRSSTARKRSHYPIEASSDCESDMPLPKRHTTRPTANETSVDEIRTNSTDTSKNQAGRSSARGGSAGQGEHNPTGNPTVLKLRKMLEALDNELALLQQEKAATEKKRDRNDDKLETLLEQIEALSASRSKCLDVKNDLNMQSEQQGVDLIKKLADKKHLEATILLCEASD